MTQHFRQLCAALIAALAMGTAMAGAYDSFFRAIELDDADRVATLIAQGFDPNAPNEAGEIGLFIALRGGAVKVARVLASHPSSNIDQANAADETPLMMAALKGNLAAAQQLLSRAATVNRPGWSPLHYAATGPEPELVRLLLDRGAAVDARSPNGSTPLMMAARYGSETSVEALLLKGASAFARNDQGLSAADFAKLGGRTAMAGRLEVRPP